MPVFIPVSLGEYCIGRISFCFQDPGIDAVFPGVPTAGTDFKFTGSMATRGDAKMGAAPMPRKYLDNPADGI